MVVQLNVGIKSGTLLYIDETVNIMPHSDFSFLLRRPARNNLADTIKRVMGDILPAVRAFVLRCLYHLASSLSARATSGTATGKNNGVYTAKMCSLGK